MFGITKVIFDIFNELYTKFDIKPLERKRYSDGFHQV